MGTMTTDMCERQTQACHTRFNDVLEQIRQQGATVTELTKELTRQGKQNERMLAQLEEAQEQRKKLWTNTDHHMEKISKLEQAGISASATNAKWLKYLGFAVAVCMMVATVLICVVGVLAFLQ